MRFSPFCVAETYSNRPEYFVRLLRYLRRKGRSREDAEDLIQEAMLRLHVYAKDNAVMNKEAFLRQAVHNLSIDQYRRDRWGHHQPKYDGVTKQAAVAPSRDDADLSDDVGKIR